MKGASWALNCDLIANTSCYRRRMSRSRLVLVANQSSHLLRSFELLYLACTFGPQRPLLHLNLPLSLSGSRLLPMPHQQPSVSFLTFPAKKLLTGPFMVASLTLSMTLVAHTRLEFANMTPGLVPRRGIKLVTTRSCLTAPS